MGTRRMKWLVLTVVAMLSLAGGAMAQRYDITVTNMTASQIFTPLLFVSHSRHVSLFQVGHPASVEVEWVAEAGNTAPLVMALEGSNDVEDIQTLMEVLPPGASVTVQLMTTARKKFISVIGMLVPTNDAMVALNGARAPRTTATFQVPAYDAGTEVNDEACANIPGPPMVCSGEGFNESREGAEGFVHVHRGIHGSVSLNAAVYDWRNPVAQITIQLAP